MSNEGLSQNPKTPSQAALEDAVRRFAEQRAANPPEDDETPEESDTKESDEERRERILEESRKAALKAQNAFGPKGPYWLEKDN
jgi:hypothetical protein